jgi:hypothetical protein
VVYYSMNNFDPANASAMQAHFRPELTGSAPKTFGECGRYLAAVIEGGQRHCNSEAYATPSDLSRSSISERFDARLHGAGINDEENAGQCCHMNGTRKRKSLLKRIDGEDSIRSQQIYFGGGETRHANAETSLIFGEISEVRQPASFSL